MIRDSSDEFFIDKQAMFHVRLTENVSISFPEWQHVQWHKLITNISLSRFALLRRFITRRSNLLIRNLYDQNPCLP